MKKLKIRQYWTDVGLPYYIVRYGHNRGDYFLAHFNNLNTYIEYGLRIAHG